MTLDEVIAIVEDETGQKVTAETMIDSLGLDSLEFLDLLIRVGNVPDEVVPHIHTVNHLYLAAVGQ